MTSLAPAYVPSMAKGREDRLESQLVKLGASMPRANSGLRLLSAPDVPGLLANLLREVDETILPRRMDVETGGRVVAQLHVAARRLLHLNLPGGQFSTPENIAAMFTNQLQTALTGATELTLRITRLSQIRIPPIWGALPVGLPLPRRWKLTRSSNRTQRVGFLKRSAAIRSPGFGLIRPAYQRPVMALTSRSPG